MSIRLNEDWALFARTKLLAIARPSKKLGEHWTAGLGNGIRRGFQTGFRRRLGALLGQPRVLVGCGSRSGRAVLSVSTSRPYRAIVALRQDGGAIAKISRAALSTS
jgi:hypothetical protein